MSMCVCVYPHNHNKNSISNYTILYLFLKDLIKQHVATLKSETNKTI